MRKYIVKRILTFMLACSMLLSEIPAYAVSDMSIEDESQEIEAEEIEEVQAFDEIEATEAKESVETLLQKLPAEEEMITQIASPSVELEKDDEGNVTGITVTNNHSEEVNIYYGLSLDGINGLSTYVTLEAGASKFIKKEWYLEYNYIEEGSYYFSVMAEGNEEYLNSEIVVLDYPITLEEVVTEEASVNIGNISGRYYFTDYDVESGKILKVFYKEELCDQSSEKLLNHRYGYYYIDKEAFDMIDKLVYEDWIFEDTGISIQRTSTSKFAIGEFAETKIPVPTVALAKDDNGNVIGIDVTNNLSKEASADGCFYSIGWSSEDGSTYAWEEPILADAACRVLFEEMEFDCPGEYLTLEVYGFCADSMSYQSEDSDKVFLHFPVKITDELKIEISDNLWIGTVKDDGTFRIDGYMSGAPERVEIPAEIDRYPVTEIGACAFINCKTLTEVYIPEGVTGIGDYAFFNCTNLKKFELPESIEFIGKNAFDEIWGNSDHIEVSIQKIGNQYYLYDVNGNKLSGYVKNQESKYYADQNGALKSGWIKIENIWHYFDETGKFSELNVVHNDGYLYTLEDGSISYFKNKTTLMKNSWITYAKSRYYFDEKGFAVKGWHQDGTYWYYADEITGKMVNTVKTIGENNYYFDGKYRLTTGWKKINNEFRYFNTDKDHEKCYEITMDGKSGWVNLSNKKRAYLNGSSGPVKGWKVIGTYKYHFDNDGFLDVGEFQDGRYFYYAETENTEEEPYLMGSVVKGIRKVGDHVYGYHTKKYYRLTGWQTIDGKRYYFNNDYVAETGWFRDGNKWYYAEPSDVVEDDVVTIPQGSVAKGFKEINGKTYLFHSSNYYRLTGWQTISKEKYYFDENGVLQIGWFKVGNYWHYAEKDGIVKKGLIEIPYGDESQKKLYYFDGNYCLKSGWVATKDARYYFDGAESPQDCHAIYSGNVTKGWFTIDGRKSYFNSSLKALTGWQTISKQRYYFDSNGILQTGWFHIDGYDYYADTNGIVKKGLVDIPYGAEQEKKLYYFDSKYRQKTGWQTISGTRYFFENAQKPEERYAADIDVPMESGWVDLGNGQKSYVNGKGAIVTEWLTIENKEVGNKKYYLGANGILQTGWFNVKGYYYYAESDGSVVKGFVELPSRDTQEKQTYYFDNSYRQKNGWQTINKQRYYFNADGELQTGWFNVGNNRYYGEPETTEDGILKGTLAKGIKVIDNETYFFHTSSYYMQTGFKSYGGKRYFLQKDGTAKTGWFSVGTDRYYGEKISSEGIYKGTLASGAKEIDGNTYFFHTKSNYRLTGWQTVSGQRYYLNADGTAKTGWFTVKGLLYYGEPETTEDGILKGTLAKGIKEIGEETYVFHSKNYNRLTGWQTVNKKKYYLQSNGIAKTGWMKSGDYWYYGTEQTTEDVMKGAMVTAVREINVLDGETTVVRRYYFDSKYRLSTGWKTIGDNRCYFNMDENPENCYLLYEGAVIKNDWYTYPDGSKSYMNNKGNPVTGWKTIDNNKYYFDTKGIMQIGWCKIGGTDYYFDEDGVNVPMNAPSFKSVSSTFYRAADVTWKPIAGAESYRLEYSTSSGFPSWRTTSVVLKNTAICEYRVEDLEPDTTYYFRMRYVIKKSIAGIDFHYNSPYGAIKNVVVCNEVEPSATSAVISACEITSGTRAKGIYVRIEATLNNRIKSADGKYYIVETESYGKGIDLAKPVGSVDKDFEIDTTVLINSGDGSNVTKECVDRALMNKFALAIRKKDGSYQVISEPKGITNPEMAAENKLPILRPTSKKGLQGIGYEQALDTNSKNTLFNLDIATVVGTKAGDGYIAYKYKGKTYYFSKCSNLVGEFKALEQGIMQYVQGITGENNKVCVTLNLLLSYKSSNAYLIDPAARVSGHKYYTLNMREEKARETFEALFMYLGELFGKSDCYVTHWVLGNEVNSSRAWNYHGSLSFNTYMQVYASAFRLLYNGVKAYKTGNNVYISLDNGWTAKPDTYSGKSTLDKFAEHAQKENPKMNWSIAYHGYSYPLTKVDFWNDSKNTTFSTSTSYISMKNISVLTDYAKMLEKKYDKPEGSIRVILSEQGYTAGGKKDETGKAQAEALARGYYTAEFNDRIDAFIIRAINDDTEEMKGDLYLGLKTYSDVKRITFYTYEFMDSNLGFFAGRDPGSVASSLKNQQKVKEAQEILGATEWTSIIPGFNLEKLANMY